uniref:Uncharacterized protein n=1 Tax=Glycine max TaxID=3847 RepID=C6T0I7_SOYBN|nr:unknown [Glycine max]
MSGTRVTLAFFYFNDNGNKCYSIRCLIIPRKKLAKLPAPLELDGVAAGGSADLVRDADIAAGGECLSVFVVDAIVISSLLKTFAHGLFVKGGAGRTQNVPHSATARFWNISTLHQVR